MITMQILNKGPEDASVNSSIFDEQGKETQSTSPLPKGKVTVVTGYRVLVQVRPTERRPATNADPKPTGPATNG
jgi:hypothetical protein